ncbi:hypothetical protein BGX29_002223 [Mortierella sp. GBA35]|nr:hypothetical protein BGX29_002223 [Mortierella sp. GBA35]
MHRGLSLPAANYNQSLSHLEDLESKVALQLQTFLGPEDTLNRTTPLTLADVGQEWIDAAKNVVSFETKLAEATLKTVIEGQDPALSYYPRTLDQQLTPSIDWSLLLSDLLPSDVEYTRPIIIPYPEYLAALETILKSTSTKTLRNYFSWRILESQASRLGAPYKQEPDEDRWRICVGAIKENLGDLAGHYFVERVLPRASLNHFKSMYDSILSTYGDAFLTLDWLDKTILDGALKKIQNMVAAIGQSREDPDGASSASLEENYRDFAIDPTDYFGNLDRKSIWSPVFNVEYPEYLNFGSMGVTTGHKIGWWTPATEQAFEEHSQRFVEQYSAFPVKGPDGQDHYHDGKSTLGENIADNGGIKYAFRAWQKRYNSDPSGKKHKNFKLPGMEKYTAEQLFFMSHSHMWCGKQTTQLDLQNLKADVHSNMMYRIIGSLRNSLTLPGPSTVRPIPP